MIRKGDNCMSTTLTSIRIDDDLLAKGKEEADFNGISFNALISNLLAERLQDIEDYNDCVKISKENNVPISREEIMRKYG
jgi:hypothetical protein